MQKDDRGVQLGFHAYQRFYYLTQAISHPKTYEEFCDSQFYLAFVKFGRHLISINAIAASEFTDWVIKKAIKIDKWCHEATYNQFLLNYVRIEACEDALTRTIENIDAWTTENNVPLVDFFKKVSVPKCINMILNARISPWVIYNCKSGRDCISSFSNEQLTLVENVIDPTFWKKKFKDYPADAELVKHILSEAGIE